MRWLVERGRSIGDRRDEAERSTNSRSRCSSHLLSPRRSVRPLRSSQASLTENAIENAISSLRTFFLSLSSCLPPFFVREDRSVRARDCSDFSLANRADSLAVNLRNEACRKPAHLTNYNATDGRLVLPLSCSSHSPQDSFNILSSPPGPIHRLLALCLVISTTIPPFSFQTARNFH